MFAIIYFLLFFIAIAFNDHSPFMKFPKLDGTFGSVMLLDMMISIGIGLLIVMVSWGIGRISDSFRNLARSFKDLLGPLSFSEIFFIAAFSSVSEEFFFRGLLQEKIGLVFSSTIFGMLHSGPGRKYLPWTIFAVGMGFVLGLTYQWRKNLLVPVIIHFVVNLLNLMVMQKLESKPEES